MCPRRYCDLPLPICLCFHSAVRWAAASVHAPQWCTVLQRPKGTRINQKLKPPTTTGPTNLLFPFDISGIFVSVTESWHTQFIISSTLRNTTQRTFHFPSPQFTIDIKLKYFLEYRLWKTGSGPALATKWTSLSVWVSSLLRTKNNTGNQVQWEST